MILKSLFISSFVGAFAWAGAGDTPLPCAQRAAMASLNETQDVGNAALGRYENRFIYPDFASRNGMTSAQLEKTVSGFGAFYCGGEGGGATLVMRDNLIVSAAHLFLKHDDHGKCTGRLSEQELSQCQFRTIDGNGKIGGEAYQIDSKSLKLGDYCNHPELTTEDVAVVELKKIVPGDRHCDLFDVSSRGGRRTNDFADLKSTNVYVVSAFNSNLKYNGQEVDRPAVCSSNFGYFEAEVDTKDDIRYLQAARCVNSEGNSGGAMIVPQNNRCALVGFVSKQISFTDSRSNKTFQGVGGPLIEGKLSQLLESCRDRCPTVSN